MDNAGSWTTHMDVIVPGVLWMLKILGAIIAGGFSCLCAVVAYVGKLWAGKIALQASHIGEMDRKLDGIVGAMSLCDGCSTAARNYRRRITDIEGDA